MKRSILILILFSLVVVSPFTGASPPPVAAGSELPGLRQEVICGYAKYGAEEEIGNHRLHRLRAPRATGQIDTQAAVPVRLVGDLAVIEDDGTLVMQPNGFDMKNRSLLFSPDENGYRVHSADIPFTKDFGQPLNRFTGADDRPTANANNGYREVSLSVAPFSFFGVTYDSMFVGTNGYVTFGRGDTVPRTSAATLAREMPRIAPLWADLDISQGGDIYYNRLNGHHLVTWAGAPEVRYGGLSTFQVALYDDGRISFAYKKVKARNALVGISRGNSTEDAQPLDFSEAAGEPIPTAAFESFSKLKRLDIPAITQAFYAAQPDAYDTLYLWTDFAFDNGVGYATAFVVRNNIQGIGISQFDRGGPYGSPSQLSSIVIGGDIVRNWIENPNINMVGLFSPVAIIAHEQGHRWLSYIRFATKQERDRDDLLGRDLNHWSFLMDTRTAEDGASSSVMEGNAWSAGERGNFRSIEAAANYFTDLDQYVMGLIPAWMVRDVTYIQVNETMHDAMRIISPAHDFAIRGEQKKVSIEQIIEQEGSRVPNALSSPKSFRIAFLLISERGTTATNATLTKLNNYRTALVNYFSLATDAHGALDSSLIGN